MKGGDVLRGFSMSEANWLLLVIAATWTVAWPLSFRRPIARALGRLAQGFGGVAQGKG